MLEPHLLLPLLKMLEPHLLLPPAWSVNPALLRVLMRVAGVHLNIAVETKPQGEIRASHAILGMPVQTGRIADRATRE